MLPSLIDADENLHVLATIGALLCQVVVGKVPAVESPVAKQGFGLVGCRSAGLKEDFGEDWSEGSACFCVISAELSQF